LSRLRVGVPTGG